MTSELANLDLATQYQGIYTITTASGAGLTISSIGTSTLQAPSHTFTLKNVLHNKITGKILFKGLCKAGYYPHSV
ncbi:hypothetical protein ACFX2I_004139 [Malus domestica]